MIIEVGGTDGNNEIGEESEGNERELARNVQMEGCLFIDVCSARWCLSRSALGGWHELRLWRSCYVTVQLQRIKYLSISYNLLSSLLCNIIPLVIRKIALTYSYIIFAFFSISFHCQILFF